VLSTFHRPKNVDDPNNYRSILERLAKLAVPVLLPLHPRSVRRASEHGLDDLLARIRVTEPIGYRDFLGLEAESVLVISDSGGVQEETSIVKRPCDCGEKLNGATRGDRNVCHSGPVRPRRRRGSQTDSG
jgi:UDP-N-acetylglucosamine 2-epimerase (non-hydrolysing)